MKQSHRAPSRSSISPPSEGNAIRECVGLSIRAALAAIVVTSAVSLPLANAQDADIRGDGSVSNPFISDGCTNRTSDGDCIVKFIVRDLRPLQSEPILYYRCPLFEPFLVKRKSNRASAPNGVDVIAQPAVDTYIAGATSAITRYGRAYATGNYGGSATNWSLSDGKYALALFCTANLDRSYY